MASLLMRYTWSGYILLCQNGNPEKRLSHISDVWIHTLQYCIHLELFLVSEGSGECANHIGRSKKWVQWGEASHFSCSRIFIWSFGSHRKTSQGHASQWAQSHHGQAIPRAISTHYQWSYCITGKLEYNPYSALCCKIFTDILFTWLLKLRSDKNTWSRLKSLTPQMWSFSNKFWLSAFLTILLIQTVWGVFSKIWHESPCLVLSLWPIVGSDLNNLQYFWKTYGRL